ncbi:TPA: hypothetical protein ACGO4F_000938 [Streptococcus suis]
MSKKRHRINPMMDIAAKKVFSDPEVTILGLKPFLVSDLKWSKL